MLSEIAHFKKQSYNFKILTLTNLIYSIVLPVIDIFVAAYVMRSSNDPVKVVVYQLTIYTGIPITFLINGYLLRTFSIKTLYSLGMMLSGISMMVMMSLTTLDTVGIGIAGLIMGMSFGFYWANRDFLALAITNDDNRNYYYGLETFFYTIIAIVIPFSIGKFIEYQVGATGDAHLAYRIVTGLVVFITILASIMCFRGKFTNPTEKKFVYFKFDPYWYKLLRLASLKGLVQGFLVTAPAMLIMLLVGKEGALGTAQSVGALIAAVVMYIIGRKTSPKHRLYVFGTGLVLFAIAAIINGVLYNSTGVILFMLLLLLAKPLLDLAYYPIQYSVIDILTKKEKRSEFAYILNHETGLYIGRLVGAGTFLVLAYCFSVEIALRYAIITVAIIQLASYWVAKDIINKGKIENVDEAPILNIEEPIIGLPLKK
jgi:YQGE family putative transporter